MDEYIPRDGTHAESAAHEMRERLECAQHRLLQGERRSAAWILTVLPPVMLAWPMLLIALAQMPSGYYATLRWVVCIAALPVAIYGYKRRRFALCWVFGTIAVLFNPVAPVYLSRTWWRSIDIATAIAFVVASVAISGRELLARWRALPRPCVLLLSGVNIVGWFILLTLFGSVCAALVMKLAHRLDLGRFVEFVALILALVWLWKGAKLAAFWVSDYFRPLKSAPLILDDGTVNWPPSSCMAILVFLVALVIGYDGFVLLIHLDWWLMILFYVVILLLLLSYARILLVLDVWKPDWRMVLQFHRKDEPSLVIVTDETREEQQKCGEIALFACLATRVLTIWRRSLEAEGYWPFVLSSLSTASQDLPRFIREEPSEQLAEIEAEEDTRSVSRMCYRYNKLVFVFMIEGSCPRGYSPYVSRAVLFPLRHLAQARINDELFVRRLELAIHHCIQFCSGPEATRVAPNQIALEIVRQVFAWHPRVSESSEESLPDSDLGARSASVALKDHVYRLFWWLVLFGAVIGLVWMIGTAFFGDGVLGEKFDDRPNLILACIVATWVFIWTVGIAGDRLGFSKRLSGKNRVHKIVPARGIT